MEEKLKDLIDKTLSVDIDRLTEEERNYPLLSRRFNVMPYQMLVLFTRIEEELAIRISDEDIVNGKFNSYNDIVNIIKVMMKDR